MCGREQEAVLMRGLLRDKEFFFCCRAENELKGNENID